MKTPVSVFRLWGLCFGLSSFEPSQFEGREGEREKKNPKPYPEFLISPHEGTGRGGGTGRGFGVASSDQAYPEQKLAPKSGVTALVFWAKP